MTPASVPREYRLLVQGPPERPQVILTDPNGEQHVLWGNLERIEGQGLGALFEVFRVLDRGEVQVRLLLEGGKR